MTKKITAVLLSTVLAASCLLGGCAKKDPQKQSGESTQNNVAAENFMVSDTAPDTNNTAEDAGNAFDNDVNTFWTAQTTEGAMLQLNFDEPTLINNVHLKEDYTYKGGNCRAYHLDAWNGEEWVKVYNSDLIRDYKLCVIDPIKTTAIRLVIDEADEESGENLKIKEFSATYQPPIKKDQDFRVVGYISPGSFTLSAYNPDQQQLDALTDVIFHSFVRWKYNAAGELDLVHPDANWETYCDMFHDSLGNRDINKFISLRNTAGDHMSSDANQRTKIVDKIIALAIAKGFNGIDVNYEHPETDAQWDAYNAFLVELCDKAHVQGLLVSAATGATSNNMTKRVLESLDQYNVMVYDNPKDYKYWHSTFNYVLQAIDAAAREGMDPAKVNIGLPFYAFNTTSTGIDWSNSRAYSSFYSPYEEEFDFGANSSLSYYYNGPTMIRDKTVYTITSGYGGVMIWHVTADTAYANKGSLTRTIHEAIQEYTTK